MVLGCTELAAHSKGVVFASNHFEKFFQVLPGMYKGWLVILASNLLAGAWLGHFARVLFLSLCHGHLRTWLHTSAMSSVGVMSYKVAMDHVQTNRVSEWYMFKLLIQPQSNSLYPDGANYLDRCFFVFLNDDKPNENKPK